MRILFVISSLGGGGMERQLFEVVRYLKKNLHTIGLITFSSGGKYENGLKKLVDEFYVLPKRPTRFEPFFSIWWPLKKFKPEIVHSWDMLSSMYIFIPSRLLRFHYIDNSIQDSGVDKGISYKIKKYLLGKAKIVIANSSAGLRYYNVPGEVVYNAIDINRFNDPIETKEFNVIMVANLHWYKDHFTFLKAAIELIKLNVVDNVYIAGDGPYRPKYESFLLRYDDNIREKIIFLGFQRNVERYLAVCKIGILSSTVEFGEGVSNSILEYMAAGLVPIATDVGGTPEIITDGVNGYLFVGGDFQQIVDKVILVKNDSKLREELVKNAKKTVAEKFSYDKNCNRLLEIYKSL